MNKRKSVSAKGVPDRNAAISDNIGMLETVSKTAEKFPKVIPDRYNTIAKNKTDKAVEKTPAVPAAIDIFVFFANAL